ncbi:MAG TPA: DUF433 domain-containing protein [Polyangiaceae bacterium]
MQPFDTPELPLHEDEHGVIRVGRTRVALESVVVAFDQGATAEELVDRYPTVSLPVMYSTIAYVMANRARVDAYLSQRQAQVAEVRTEVEQCSGPDGLRARLLSGHEPRVDFSVACRDRSPGSA